MCKSRHDGRQMLFFPRQSPGSLSSEWTGDLRPEHGDRDPEGPRRHKVRAKLAQDEFNKVRCETSGEMVNFIAEVDIEGLGAKLATLVVWQTS